MYLHADAVTERVTEIFAVAVRRYVVARDLIQFAALYARARRVYARRLRFQYYVVDLAHLLARLAEGDCSGHIAVPTVSQRAEVHQYKFAALYGLVGGDTVRHSRVRAAQRYRIERKPLSAVSQHEIVQL